MRRRAKKTQMIHARVDPKLKRSAERVFSDIGLSTTEAIRIFLRQVELHRGLPFPVHVPNDETIAAMRESNTPEKLRHVGSFRELSDQL